MKRLVPLLALLAACSGEPAPPATPAAETRPKTPPPPSVADARTLIADSAELGEYQFTNAAVSIPVAGSSMSDPVRAMARELAAAKWIALDGAGDVMLTERARNDKRFLLRANGILDIVPLAKKEMGDVTVVTPQPDGTAAADFTWRWIPNEVGAVFKSGPVHDRFAESHEARATLIWDGTSWSVLSIEERR
jgi:hypothetical protein